MPMSQSALAALGNFIRQEREDRGWTQTELAARMGEDGGQKSNISRWEAGEVDEPKLSSLIDLADALEVSRWRVVEFLYPLERPPSVVDDIRQRVERLMTAFPWLVMFFDDLVALADSDRKAVITFLEYQKQQPDRPVRRPQRASGRG